MRFACFATSSSALAAGCLLIFSADEASESSVDGSTPLAGVSFVTYSRPVVSVPVLSKTIAVILPASSRSATFLTSMPRRAAADIAATIALGVARISAQGQPITRMVMAMLILPVKNKAIPAIIRTVGVYHLT